MAREAVHAGYTLSDDPGRIDAAAVKAYLARSYWADKRPAEVVETSLLNSLCVGIYAPSGALVGLIRVVTDYATFAYLCDVYVLSEHRGKGLSKAGLAFVDSHPRLATVGRFILATRDAHSLYAQFGYIPLPSPERFMEKRTSAFSPIDFGRKG